MEEQVEGYISYKIDTKHTYKVYVNSAGGKTFYKVCVKKKNYDGTETKFYKQLKFVQCDPPEDGEIIKINRAFEDLYVNSKDKYNAISVIAIMDYEKVDNDVVAEQQAYEDYRENLNSMEVSDEDLPF